MKALMKLPIQYQGVLENVRLLNFSVDPEEILPHLPKGIEPHLYRNRALFSMVNVQLKNMRPTATGDLFRFSYRHVALRLLIKDTHLTGEGQHRGIYFYKSFTDNPLVYHGAKLLTTFRFEKANINDLGYLFELRADDGYIKYALDHHTDANGDVRLKQRIATVDRAYAPIGKNLYCLQVHRDHWPIEWVECYRFETNIFESARFEGAFQINVPIDYQWGGMRKVVQPVAVAPNANHPQQPHYV